MPFPFPVPDKQVVGVTITQYFSSHDGKIAFGWTERKHQIEKAVHFHQKIENRTASVKCVEDM